MQRRIVVGPLAALLFTACAQGGFDLPDAGAGRDGGRDATATTPDGGCPDADGDGVCDAADRCHGHDDARDTDDDGVPDGCDCDASASECAPEARCEDGTDGVDCTCPDGYVGDGRTCAPSGCPAPSAPDNGSVGVEGEGIGAVATYACDGGYTLVGATSRVCQADGAYDGAVPSCVRIDCGPPPPVANGAVSAPETTSGAVATYACDAGYVITGDAMRSCQLDGAWSGATPSCAPVDCGALSGVSNGSVVVSGTTYGSSASYACNTGYTLVGSATRTCQADGAWSGSAPSCTPVSCGTLPSPTNGTVTLSGTTYGASAVYACNAGYSMVGSSTRTCQATGTWSGSAPSCVAACPVPAAPTNGNVSYTGVTEGSTATYTCSAGFLLSGASHNRCGPSGWVGATPTCRRILSCACSSVFAEGDRVRAAVDSPAGATGISAGHLGTALAGSSTVSLPILVSWDAWTSGHSGICDWATCGTCNPPTGSSRWWSECASVATQRLTCACGGAFSQGDRVVALVNGPSGASGILAGRTGTVIAGSTGGLPVLIQWDAWTSGHTGNCGVAACGVCTTSASANRWWTACDVIGRAP